MAKRQKRLLTEPGTDIKVVRENRFHSCVCARDRVISKYIYKILFFKWKH